MSSFNELKVEVNNPLPGFIRKHQLYRFLAFGGAACLMFWLSSGLIPQAWQLSLLACLQFPVLLKARGMGFLPFFLLLLAQSLLLLVGWGLYLWLAIREIRGFQIHSHTATPSDLMIKTPETDTVDETTVLLHGSSALNDSFASSPASEYSRKYPTHEHSEAQSRSEFNPFEGEIASADTLISPLSHSIEKPVQASSLYASLPDKVEEMEYFPTVELNEVPASASSTQERSRSSLKKTNLKRNILRKGQPTVVEADEKASSPSSLVQRTSLISLNDIKGYDQQLMPEEITPARRPSFQARDAVPSASEQALTRLTPDAQEPTEEEPVNPFYESEVGQEAPNFASILHDLGFFNLGQTSVEQEKVPQISPPQPKVKLVPASQNKGEEIQQQEDMHQPEVPEIKKFTPEQKKRGVMIQQANTNLPETSEIKKLTSEVNPFEVHADILDLFASPSDVSSNKEEEDVQAILPLPGELPPDQLYVYGNPFEEPLPDIFQHDEELKKSVLGRVIEEMEERTEKRTEGPSQDTRDADRQKRAAKPFKRNKNH